MFDKLLAALAARFGGNSFHRGKAPAPIAIFPRRHPEVGDVRVSVSGRPELMTIDVAIGDIIHDSFHSFDTHLPAVERERRVTAELVRFLDHLFSDRLLFWKSTDGACRAGWRERGEAGHTDPLVMDDRTYRTYLWSGPIENWRASTRILRRGRIADEREYDILSTRLQHGGADGFDEALTAHERELALRLLAEYEAEQ